MTSRRCGEQDTFASCYADVPCSIAHLWKATGFPVSRTRQGTSCYKFGLLDWNLFAGCRQSYAGQRGQPSTALVVRCDGNSLLGVKKAVYDFVDLHPLWADFFGESVAVSVTGADDMKAQEPCVSEIHQKTLGTSCGTAGGHRLGWFGRDWPCLGITSLLLPSHPIHVLFWTAFAFAAAYLATSSASSMQA